MHVQVSSEVIHSCLFLFLFLFVLLSCQKSVCTVRIKWKLLKAWFFKNLSHADMHHLVRADCHRNQETNNPLERQPQKLNGNKMLVRICSCCKNEQLNFQVKCTGHVPGSIWSSWILHTSYYGLDLFCSNTAGCVDLTVLLVSACRSGATPDAARRL